MGAILHPGFLYWDGLKYITTGGSNLASGPAGGDLSGTYPNPIVSGLQSHAVSSAVPTNGQVLTWIAVDDQWVPTTFTTILAGDVTGAIGSNTVVALQGHPVATQTSGSLHDGYVLTWNGSAWIGLGLNLTESASGDLGDFYPNPTVRKIWEAYVPQAGSGVPPGYVYSGAAFAVGNVLQVINTGIGTQALGYAPLNLSGGTNVTGVLPTANQAPQAVGGDLSGTAAAAHVIQLRGNPLGYQVLGGYPAYDGYVLTWSYSANQWMAQPSTTGTALAGDITGAFTATTVSKLQGVPLGASGPADGNVIVYSAYDGAYINSHLYMNFEGDIAGTWQSGITNTSTITLEKIKGKTLDTALATLDGYHDGYVLTWVNGSNEWKALPSAGIGSVTLGGDLGGVSGDVLVIGIQGNPVSTATPAAYQVLSQNNVGSQSSWQYIVDNNVDTYANIQGSKIFPNFISTVECPALLSTGNVEAAAFSVGYTVPGVTSPPRILAASSAPSGASGYPNGTILLNTTGAADGYESIFATADGNWVAIGAAAAGLAGGDLTGNFPNPTVAAINGKAVNYYAGLSNGYILTWNTVDNCWLAEENDLYTVGGEQDLTGYWPNITVKAIQKNNIENVQYGSNPIYDGYVLTWNYLTEEWRAKPIGSTSGVAGGDLYGSYPNPQVRAINYVAVNANPTANTVLVATSYTTSSWEFISDAQVSSTAAIEVSKLASGTANQVLINNATPTPAWTTLSGDVTNSLGVLTVNKIQGVAISGTPVDGYVLTATTPTAASWQPSGSGAISALTGDVTASGSGSVVATVVNIHGASVPAAGSLVTGTVLRVTGTSSLGYGAVDLTNSSAVSGALPAAHQASQTMNGDVSGTTGASTVIALRNYLLATQTLGSSQDGYVLTWDNADGYWKAEAGASGSFAAGGDLSGDSVDQTVIGIQGNAVQSGLLGSAQDGYVLTWTNGSSNWEAKKISTTLSGDVTGPDSSNTVTKLQGFSVANTSPTNGYVLTWNSGLSHWQPTVIPTQTATGSAGGDLSGTYPSPTVAKIQGNTVTAGALTKGQFFIATSTSNWSATSLSGDVSESGVTAGLLTVTALQGYAVNSVAPADGYVLTWDATDGYWKPEMAASGSFTAGGDLSGSSVSQTVIALRGKSLSTSLASLGATQDGYGLVWNNGTSEWEAKSAPSGSFTAGGDLSGTSSSQNVIKIQGNSVQSGILGSGQDGYVLTWVNADSEWEPKPVTGGGSETGKVVFTSKTVTSSYSIDASEYDYYIFCNQSAPINITLPNPTVGRTVVIKDISGNAFTNNITVLQYAGENIEGVAGSFAILTNNGSATLAADNSGNWWVV